jgi:hypothetical protein
VQLFGAPFAMIKSVEYAALHPTINTTIYTAIYTALNLSE